MITLIAESKNMSPSRSSIDKISPSTPMFQSVAEEIAHSFAPMSVEEIADRLGLSIPLATKAKKLFFNFQNGTTGSEALFTFTGEVFRALDASSLMSSSIEFASDKVGIISSLYGFLNPADIVLPYRFDYDIENPSTGVRMRDFWKPKLTIAFVRILKERGEKEVLDLLPAEAGKCLDWKLIKNFVKVVKVNFKTVNDNGQLKTPHSGKIKEMRGKLLREILTDKINHTADVLQIQTPMLAFDPELSKKDYPTFISV